MKTKFQSFYYLYKSLFLPVLVYLYLFSFSFSLRANEKRAVTLKWQEVETAISYIIEIEDEKGNQILKQEVGENFIPTELEPGKYKRKISVINKLGELESESDWKTFIVQVILPPEIEKDQTISSSKENSGKALVKGNHFHPSMQVQIRKGDKIYPLENSKVIDSENLELVIKDEIPPGDYDLILVNPGKKAEFPGVVQKKESKESKEKEGRWEVVKRSAILPGWGQYYAGQKIQNPDYDFRGKVYFGGFLTLSLFYLYFNEFTLLPNAETPTQKKFKDDSARNLALAVGLPNESNNFRRLFSLYSLSEMNKQAELVNLQSQRVNIILFAMVGVYLTQLIDAYFIERKDFASPSESWLYPKFQFQYKVGSAWEGRNEDSIKFQYNLFF